MNTIAAIFIALFLLAVASVVLLGAAYSFIDWWNR